MRGHNGNLPYQLIFVTARSASKRLPNKCYLEINDVPNIERLISRMKKSKEANFLVLCTTTNPEDDKLAYIANCCNLQVYRGSADDKIERWRNAAREFDCDFFVTADGDDLFCDPELADMAIRQYRKTKADLIDCKDIVVGGFSYGLSRSACEKICEIKNTTDTEMIEPYFKDTGLFKCESLQDVPDIYKHPELRMTLDYSEDFDFFKEVIGCLEPINPNFTLQDVIIFLDGNPGIVAINQSLQEKFLANQKAKTKLVLK